MSKTPASLPRAKEAGEATEIDVSIQPRPLQARNDHWRIPLSSQALFWRPRHAAASPALGQIPFLFWLLEALRPRTIVQAGTGDGVLYMSLCQGSERLGESTICLGLEAQDPVLPAAMRPQHDAQYSDFSELRVGGLETAVPNHIGNIDLLVLTSPLGADAVVRFQNGWLSHLSDRAVVLLCNPEAILPDPAARDVLFAGREGTIVSGPVSAGGHGLEAVLYGKAPAERLLALATQQPGEHAYLATRQVFNRLGQGIEAIQKAEDLQKERDGLRISLLATQENLTARQSELDRQRLAASAAETAEAAEVSRQAQTAARLFDAEQSLSDKSKQANLLHEEGAKLAQRVAELEAQAAKREAEHQVAMTAAQQHHDQAVRELQDKLNAVNGAHAKLDEQINLIKVERDDQVSLLSDVHKLQLSERDALAEALRKDKTAIEGQLRETRAALEQQTKSITTQNESHKAEMVQSRTQIDALTGQKAEMEGLLKDARAALDQQVQADRTLQEQLKAEIAKLQIQFDVLQKEKSAIERQRDEFRATSEARVGDIAALTHKYDEDLAGLRQELGTLHAANTMGEMQLNKARAAHGERLTDLAVLTEKYSQELSGVQDDLEASRAAGALLETQLKDAQAAHEERITDIAILTAKYKEDNASLRMQLEDLRAVHATSEAQHQDLRVPHEARVEELVERAAAHNQAMTRPQGELQGERAKHGLNETRLASEQTARDRRIATLEYDHQAAVSAHEHARVIIADLHKAAAEELGRAVLALLPTEKFSLLAKKLSPSDQALLLVDKGIVDPDWYLRRHTDVAAAEMDPALHYVLHGAREGRPPGRKLDEAAQLN